LGLDDERSSRLIRSLLVIVFVDRFKDEPRKRCELVFGHLTYWFGRLEELRLWAFLGHCGLLSVVGDVTSTIAFCARSAASPCGTHRDLVWLGCDLFFRREFVMQK
jgi:hypothetical protein